MSAQLHDTGKGVEGRKDEGGRGGLVGGVVLIAAGLVVLAGQLFTMGAWPLVLLGLIFTAAGVATHTAGWLIPGGVLNGIGLGALLTENGLAVGEPMRGGAFLLAFALGWASIYVLSRLFTKTPLRWALIPAAVMALIGTPLLFGAQGEAALALVLGWLAYLWPVALIAAGAVLLVRFRRR